MNLRWGLWVKILTPAKDSMESSGFNLKIKSCLKSFSINLPILLDIVFLFFLSVKYSSNIFSMSCFKIILPPPYNDRYCYYLIIQFILNHKNYKIRP